MVQTKEQYRLVYSTVSELFARYTADLNKENLKKTQDPNGEFFDQADAEWMVTRVQRRPHILYPL
jgi:hypothetical protein